MTAVAARPPAPAPAWKSCSKASASAGSVYYPRCEPVDAALARTVAEHIHCGEPMAPVTDTGLPVTAPLMILTPETAAPEPRDQAIRTYRCRCGFILDAPAETVE